MASNQSTKQQGGEGVLGLGKARVQQISATADLQESKQNNDLGEENAGNEGQRMVWHLQDLQETMDAENIQEVQLLPGFDLASTVDEKRKNRRLFKPENGIDTDMEGNRKLDLLRGENEDDFAMRDINDGFA